MFRVGREVEMPLGQILGAIREQNLEIIGEAVSHHFAEEGKIERPVSFEVFKRINELAEEGNVDAFQELLRVESGFENESLKAIACAIFVSNALEAELNVQDSYIIKGLNFFTLAKFAELHLEDLPEALNIDYLELDQPENEIKLEAIQKFDSNLFKEQVTNAMQKFTRISEDEYGELRKCPTIDFGTLADIAGFANFYDGEDAHLNFVHPIFTNPNQFAEYLGINHSENEICEMIFDHNIEAKMAGEEGALGAHGD